MVASSFGTLKKVIEAHSVADDFYHAVEEWQVTSVEEHPSGEGECVCGQQDLLYMYTIRNRHTGAPLTYIGSKCVEHFKRGDLNLQVSVFRSLFDLRKKILAGDRIFLSSDFFSRESLKWLYEEGAFPGTQYNHYNGAADYEFLRDMFNKHNKDNITKKQQSKIRGLLYYTIMPFVRDHPALG